MSSLRPSAKQMRRFAMRETEPERARSFEPIVAGPVVAILLLAAIGVLGALATPFAIVARLLDRER